MLVADGKRTNAPARRVFMAALWLAALCPFTANYAAVPLTEVFAIFFTAAALLPLCLLVGRTRNNGWMFIKRELAVRQQLPVFGGAGGAFGWRGHAVSAGDAAAAGCGVDGACGCSGFAARSEALAFHRCGRWALVCAMPLVPWAVRNAVTLHEFQLLAPKNSNLPGELVPYGFMSWEKTWLYRFRDVYLVPWKLNDEAIRVEDIPARAFDTPEERDRVAAILEPYNNDLTLTPEEDAAFGRARAGADGAASAANLCVDAARARGDHVVYAADRADSGFGHGVSAEAVVAGRQDRSVRDGGIFPAEHCVCCAGDPGERWRLWRRATRCGPPWAADCFRCCCARRSSPRWKRLSRATCWCAFRRYSRSPRRFSLRAQSNSDTNIVIARSPVFAI